MQPLSLPCASAPLPIEDYSKEPILNQESGADYPTRACMNPEGASHLYPNDAITSFYLVHSPVDALNY
jgi:hypothetical protein